MVDTREPQASIADRARAAEPGITRRLVGETRPGPDADLRDLADVAVADGGAEWDR